jgi:hypothetical protein
VIIQINEAKDSPERKKHLENKEMEKLIIYVLLMKIKKIFLPLSEAAIQGLLHPAQANLGYLLVWFQSLHLPSTQSESPLAVIPLASKSHVSFKACTQL